MDSKLKRKVVAVAVVMVLLVVATVFGANYIKTGMCLKRCPGQLQGQIIRIRSPMEQIQGIIIRIRTQMEQMQEMPI